VKLKSKGYNIDILNDASELAAVTTFERNLPICKVGLDDYERRLKKLVDNEDFLTEKQLVEVFKDHVSCKEI